MTTHRHLPAILLAMLYLSTIVFTGPKDALLILLILLAPPLIWATVTDLAQHVIPDTATAIVAVIGLGFPFMQGRTPDPVTMGIAVLIPLLLAAASEWYWRRHQTEALGLGDIKLIGAGTLVVGASNLWLMIALAAVGGTISALLAQRRQQNGIPFGPFLAYAIFAIAATSGGECGWHEC